MQIFVKDLTGKTITLDVASGDTVASLKDKIQVKTGISPDLQILLSGNTSLNASQTLSDYNLQQRSILSLVALPKTYTTTPTPSVGVITMANGSEDKADTPVKFLFYRTGDTSQAATIDYNLMGNAQSGKDYTGATKSSVTFAAGSNTALLSLPVLQDSIIDPISLYTSHVIAAARRAYRTPSTKTAMSCIPSQIVLTPGSPSPLRARNPPSCAIRRTTVLRSGTDFGTGFLFRINAAFHSSVSNTRSAGRSPSVRPSRISLLIRQAITI